MSFDEKQRAFEAVEKSLDKLIDYFNFRGNPATESDFYRLNVTEQKMAFLRQLMMTD
jgi:hypothetical protein